MEEIANHKDIPGNPSTAKSSKLTLNKRINGEPLNFLSSDQWDFWLENGYVIIKSAVSKNQAKKTALLASRTNTVLSIPMLLFMGSGHNLLGI